MSEIKLLISDEKLKEITHWKVVFQGVRKEIAHCNRKILQLDEKLTEVKLAKHSSLYHKDNNTIDVRMGSLAGQIYAYLEMKSRLRKLLE